MCWHDSKAVLLSIATSLHTSSSPVSLNRKRDRATVVTMPPGTRPNATGSKTVTYVGTGPAGATVGAGPVKETPEVPVEPASAAINHAKGKVLLQGCVVKSVVSHEVNNTGSLNFKGKTSNTNSNTQDHIVKPIKHGAGDALADITVTRDAKMCIVTVKMTTDGISFDDCDD